MTDKDVAERFQDRLARAAWEGFCNHLSHEDLKTYRHTSQETKDQLRAESRAVARAVLYHVVDAFGDLEWPKTGGGHSVLAVEIARWAADRGINIPDDAP